MKPPLKPALAWALVGVAIAAAAAAQGWRGVLLVVTITVFWLLYQLNSLTRSLRRLAQRPLGVVSNAVMFNAALSPGMRLAQVLKLSDSLGRAVDVSAGEEARSFVWTDAGGDSVRVDLQDGRVETWSLHRAEERHGERIEELIDERVAYSANDGANERANDGANDTRNSKATT